jgi:hypothetical protein
MRTHFSGGLVCALLSLSATLALAQTNILTNGSFESGLTGWSQAASYQTGATGTCGYNAATAPGTETLLSIAGFPATAGTQIALGSAQSLNAGVPRTYCALYQDVAIPAGATTATFSLDLGVKGYVDGGFSQSLVVALASAAAPPAATDTPLSGTPAIVVDASIAQTALQSHTSSSFDISAWAGTTVRLIIVNGTNHADPGTVVGLDNVKLLVTAPVATPTLSEWGLLALGGLLVGAGLLFSRQHFA